MTLPNYIDKPERLGGYLLRYKGPPASSGVSASDIEQELLIRKSASIEPIGWEFFSLLTKESLRPDREEEGRGPYRYEILCRRLGAYVILASDSRNIVDYLLSKKRFMYADKPPFVPIKIHVDRLVRKITHDPTSYAINFVHAKVSGFGDALKSMSLYGDDITEAKLFRDSIDLMSCTRCGLSDISEGFEVIRVGNDGSINFFDNPFERLVEVEVCVANLISWGVIPAP